MNAGLDKKIELLRKISVSHPMICITFRSGEQGDRTEYAIGLFSGISEDNNCVMLSNGFEIPIPDIISIDGDIF